nr:MAG TPA: hypothetical protein [Caudoviricetes sp.]
MLTTTLNPRGSVTFLARSRGQYFSLCILHF